MTPEKLAERLRRVEQQIRAFKELHASELQIILDELADIRSDLADAAAPTEGAPAGPGATEARADPAARSPKRAKWLEEEARKAAPMSRREFLRGREDREAT